MSDTECNFPFEKGIVLLSDFLETGHLPDIPVGDEPGVAMSGQGYGDYSFDFDYYSRVHVKDSRYRGHFVGFLPQSEYTISTFLRTSLNRGTLDVLPRRTVIDESSDWTKLVVVIFVKYRDFVVLIPRGQKKILPEVATVSVMESVVASDFDGILNENLNRELLVNQIARRSVQEECDCFPWQNILFTGLVGSRVGDLGFVYGLECDSKDALVRIAYQTNGVIYNAYKHEYEKVLGYHGMSPDGWSKAILAYLMGDCLQRRI